MSCQVDNVLNVARQKTMLTSQDHYQQIVANMLACIIGLTIEDYEFFGCDWLISSNKDKTCVSLPKTCGLMIELA